MNKQIIKGVLAALLIATGSVLCAQPGGGGGNPGGGTPPSTTGPIDSGAVMLIITVSGFALYNVKKKTEESSAETD